MANFAMMCVLTRIRKKSLLSYTELSGKRYEPMIFAAAAALRNFKRAASAMRHHSESKKGLSHSHCLCWRIDATG